jgi:hypothetical protein
MTDCLRKRPTSELFVREPSLVYIYVWGARSVCIPQPDRAAADFVQDSLVSRIPTILRAEPAGSALSCCSCRLGSPTLAHPMRTIGTNGNNRHARVRAQMTPVPFQDSQSVSRPSPPLTCARVLTANLFKTDRVLTR